MKKANAPPIDLEADSSHPPPTDDQMKGIALMVKNLLSLEKEVTDMEELLAEKQKKVTYMSEIQIPEAMKLIHLKMFKMDDDKTVEVKSTVYGSYTKAHEQAVFEWLRKNGHGSIIKDTVNVEVGKGGDSIVSKLMNVLSQKAYVGCVVERKEAVHQGSFKALVRELLEAGTKLPKQIATFEKSETVIKEPKNGTSKKAASSTSKKAAASQDKF